MPPAPRGPVTSKCPAKRSPAFSGMRVAPAARPRRAAAQGRLVHLHHEAAGAAERSRQSSPRRSTDGSSARRRARHARARSAAFAYWRGGGMPVSYWAGVSFAYLILQGRACLPRLVTVRRGRGPPLSPTGAPGGAGARRAEFVGVQSAARGLRAARLASLAPARLAPRSARRQARQDGMMMGPGSPRSSLSGRVRRVRRLDSGPLGSSGQPGTAGRSGGPVQSGRVDV